jgi:pSer/pThr/pTyr-binding forkhead associated (FHA) protein
MYCDNINDFNEQEEEKEYSVFNPVDNIIFLHGVGDLDNRCRTPFIDVEHEKMEIEKLPEANGNGHLVAPIELQVAPLPLNDNETRKHPLLKQQTEKHTNKRRLELLHRLPTSKNGMIIDMKQHYYTEKEYFIKINIEHQSNSNQVQKQEYKFTDKELKFQQDKNIYIGRQPPLNPNNKLYIVTPPDKLVSRSHAKINCVEGFPAIRQAAAAFYEFLKLYYIEKSSSTDLPLGIFKMIAGYLKETPKFYLYDLGSISGVFISIKFQERFKIRVGNELVLGTYTHLSIKSMGVQWLPEVFSQDLFLKFLMKLFFQKGAQLFGLSAELTDTLELMLQNPSTYVNTDLQYLGINLDEPAEFGIPYLVMLMSKETTEVLTTNQPLEYKYFVLIAGIKTTFILGRNTPDNDINFDDHSISRKHAKIWYEQGAWYISEGVDKATINGTWHGLTDYRVKKERNDSDAYLLKNNEEIRIGYCKLQITYKAN